MSSPVEPERRGWSDDDVQRIQTEARRDHHEAEAIVRELSAARLAQLKRGSRGVAAAALRDPILTPNDNAALAAWLGDGTTLRATKPFRRRGKRPFALRWLKKLSVRRALVGISVLAVAGLVGKAWLATPSGFAVLKQATVLEWHENGRAVGIQGVKVGKYYDAFAINKPDQVVTVRAWVPTRGYFEADVPLTALR